MTINDALLNAYVLHARPYKEEHALVEMFTLEMGRIGVVFRRVLGRRNARSALLQPFQPLYVSIAGTGELRSGRQLEERSLSVWLTGERLFSGFYLNELLLRMLQRDDPHPGLFACYEETVAALARDDLEPVLRRFERRLLADTGYDMPFDGDVAGEPIDADGYYRLVADQGFERIAHAMGDAVFAGRDLIAIEAEEYSDPAVRRSAKRLFRAALKPHLGDRPLNSREFFMRSAGQGSTDNTH